MIKRINLQMFGGRGGASGLGGAAAKAFNTNFTSKEIDAMSRSQLETVAMAVYAKKNAGAGLPTSEALRRAKLLLDGNSTAQLRKYIKKNKG